MLISAPLSLQAASFADPAFQRVWATADASVASGRVNISWLWGPAPFTAGVQESYAQSANGTRLVQYFDKARMEINDPSTNPQDLFHVTSGLLPIELITGQMQVGDAQFEQRQPAQIPVVGDLSNTFPTYADLAAVYTRQGTGAQIGTPVTSLLRSAGVIGDYDAFRDDQWAVIARVENGHGIPQIFDLLQRSTTESYGGLRLLYVYGAPVSSAYWVNARVNGIEQPVMFQVFERRVLTYTPANPRAFQVEAGNVGRHYYQWRYGLAPRAALTTFFAALHDKRYSQAAQLYGGSYDVLVDYNPPVRPTDYATLFTNACEANGFVCFPIKRIVREEAIMPTEYRFVVEFLAEDGSTFVRGPCCGASEEDQPSVSQFTYTVKQEQGRFLVQELPVYKP